jgi:hypothetical protein
VGRRENLSDSFQPFKLTALSLFPLANLLTIFSPACYEFRNLAVKKPPFDPLFTEKSRWRLEGALHNDQETPAVHPRAGDRAA